MYFSIQIPGIELILEAYSLVVVSSWAKRRDGELCFVSAISPSRHQGVMHNISSEAFVDIIACFDPINLPLGGRA